MPRKPRKKRIRERDQHGLCQCSSGCTGLSVEFDDVGVLSLYLHAQRKTQAAQSRWVPYTEDSLLTAGDFILTKDKSHKQACICCNIIPDSNYYRIPIGRSVVQTIHKECLEKLISIPKESLIEICFEAGNNPISRMFAKLNMTEAQRLKFKISRKDLRTAKKLQDKRVRRDSLTEEEFLKWRDEVLIKFRAGWDPYIPFSVVFSGKINGLDLKVIFIKYNHRTSFAVKVKGDFRASKRVSKVLAWQERNIPIKGLLSFLSESPLHYGLLQDSKELRFKDLFTEKIMGAYCTHKYGVPFDKQAQALMLTDEDEEVRKLIKTYSSLSC